MTLRLVLKADNHDGGITHLEPDILECEVKWALGSVTMNKARQCILSPCLFNLYAEYIMRNTVLEEAQAGIKIAGEILITSDVQMIPPLWQEVKKN